MHVCTFGDGHANFQMNLGLNTCVLAVQYELDVWLQLIHVLSDREALRKRACDQLFVTYADAGAAASAWLALRLQLLAACLVSAVALLAVNNHLTTKAHAGQPEASSGVLGAVEAEASLRGTTASSLGIGQGHQGMVSWWVLSSFHRLTVSGAPAGLAASLAGLSLAYALPIVGLLNGLLTSSAETEQVCVPSGCACMFKPSNV